MNPRTDLPYPPRPWWHDPPALRTITYLLVAAAAGWFLLTQLAVVLRPLMLAVIVSYTLIPSFDRLRRYVPGPVAVVLLAGVTAGVLVLLAVAVHASLLGLTDELPRLQAKAVELVRRADRYAADHVPGMGTPEADGRQIEEWLGGQAGVFLRSVLNAAAGALAEAGVVGLYVLFLLLEASRFPARVRRAYSPDRADEILKLAGHVNAAVISYLRAKVRSSLLLAVPVGLVLWAFGVKFALFWAVLTFLCNFIPYAGSVVGFSLPVGFAVLQLDGGWSAVWVAGLVLACHISCAAVVEPTLLGKAVGLSPLVILGSLAFWGLLWGVPGMVLAVPLTAVAVIVMDQFAVTRPVARMAGGD